MHTNLTHSNNRLLLTFCQNANASRTKSADVGLASVIHAEPPRVRHGVRKGAVIGKTDMSGRWCLTWMERKALR